MIHGPKNLDQIYNSTKVAIEYLQLIICNLAAHTGAKTLTSLNPSNAGNGIILNTANAQLSIPKLCQKLTNQSPG